MKLTIEADLIVRVPDSYDCSDPDFAIATIKVTGTPDNWTVTKATWKSSGDKVEPSVLRSKNNVETINELANEAAKG